MKSFLLIFATLTILSAPLQAQQANPYDGFIDDLILELNNAELATPDGEVLTIMCDTSPSGNHTLAYRRRCPFGENVEAATVFASLSSGLTVNGCDGPPEETQILIVATDQELAAAGRDLKALCRNLPFDEAPVCN
jgi:hypothetical protein